MFGLVKLVRQLRGTVLAYPGIARVAYDLQEPCAAISSTKTTKKPQCPEKCLLHYVLGVGGAAHKPARKVVSRIQMRQHQLLETLRHLPQFSHFVGR